MFVCHAVELRIVSESSNTRWRTHRRGKPWEDVDLNYCSVKVRNETWCVLLLLHPNCVRTRCCVVTIVVCYWIVAWHAVWVAFASRSQLPEDQSSPIWSQRRISPRVWCVYICAKILQETIVSWILLRMISIDSASPEWDLLRCWKDLNLFWVMTLRCLGRSGEKGLTSISVQRALAGGRLSRFGREQQQLLRQPRRRAVWVGVCSGESGTS